MLVGGTTFDYDVLANAVIPQGNTANEEEWRRFGRVLLAATTTAWSPRRPVTVRLLADGSPDPAYGTAGVAAGPDYDVRFNVDLAPLPRGGAILGMAGFQGTDQRRRIMDLAP